MKEFILNNWKTILLICFAIAELLVLVLKKSVKVDSTDSKISRLVAFYISVAERLIGKGQGAVKKSYVIESVKDFLKLDSSYDEVISTYIENILSTPQKKGIDDEKK